MVRVPDLTAAGHDEPGPLRAGEGGPAQPVPDDAGDAPGIGGGNQDEPLPGLHRGGIPGPEAVVDAEKRLSQGICDAPGHIPAVAGAGEGKYHDILLARRARSVNGPRGAAGPCGGAAACGCRKA